MTQLDHEAAKDILEATFTYVEQQVSEGRIPGADAKLRASADVIFSSKTSAYRETLLGCILARLTDESVNVRTPYANQAADAFSGRALDERVVNPFLQSKRIPCSKGPYLSVFRRNVRFDRETRKGVMDKPAYDAFDSFLSGIEETHDDEAVRSILAFVLYRFLLLREESFVEVTNLTRISLTQYELLLSDMIATPSGGRIPVILVLAAFRMLDEHFGLRWTIDVQEINVADRASGAGGDITITTGGKIVLAAEITERPVEVSRVQSTFRTKISPLGIEDYLFFVDLKKVDPQAKKQAHNYFAQGHEVNFVDFKDWILMILATVGRRGRTLFNYHLISQLATPSVPKAVKLAWNNALETLTSSPSS